MPKRKPSKELFVVWKEELQRHCEEETTEQQKERTSQSNVDGDRQFKEEGRTAEITIDLVLRAKKKMAGSLNCRRDDQGAPV